MGEVGKLDGPGTSDQDGSDRPTKPCHSSRSKGALSINPADAHMAMSHTEPKWSISQAPTRIRLKPRQYSCLLLRRDGDPDGKGDGIFYVQRRA
jgi:hypothetical protein